MFDPFYLLVAVIFLTMITLLVAAHELGHYLFARMFGMGVEEFAIGFGKKPIFTWLRKRYRVDPEVDTLPANPEEEAGHANAAPRTAYETTVFTVRPFPLGGFVKIKGMTPEEDGSEIYIPGGFYSKSPWQRFVVLLMGPVFSILAGFAVLIPLFMTVGVMKPTNAPRVPWIAGGSPAERAMLKPGDVILSVDGKKVAKFVEVLRAAHAKGEKPMTLVVRRDGATMKTTLTPKISAEPTLVLGPDLEPTGERRRQPMLGIGIDQARQALPVGDAIGTAFSMPVRMVASLAGVVKQPSKFKDELGGPVSMVALTAGTAREGLDQVLYLAGVLSISLGIFNLLPISPLDGGQMTVAFVEMLRRGRRLSFRVQNFVAGVGFLLIVALIVGVFAADINRFLPGKKDEKQEKAPVSQPK
jgi:regulator of sigma E protease